MANPIKREDSFILFHVGIPVHPAALAEYDKTRCIDYPVMNHAIDQGLEWTYQDLMEHGDLMPSDDWTLQTPDRKGTKDIEVMRSWISGGEHEYYRLMNDCLYYGKDEESFPFKYMTMSQGGLYIGQTPIIIVFDDLRILKDTVRHFGKKTPLPQGIMEDYGFTEDETFYRARGMWYTKDAQPIVRLFGKNVAVNYNNAIAMKTGK